MIWVPVQAIYLHYMYALIITCIAPWQPHPLHVTLQAPLVFLCCM